jgi:hypothetical protein
MNPNPDPENEVLLDAVLDDEAWKTLSAELKRQAVGTFIAQRRWRRIRHWAGGAVALVILVASTIYWTGHPAKTIPEVTANRIKRTSEPPAVHFISDEDLLAAFPKGSCFIAEVDGKKELVFLDPKMERAHLAK